MKKRNTIKWRIFKYNLIVIIMLITLVTIIFNVAVKLYIEKEIFEQLNKIASQTEDTAIRKGPGFFQKPERSEPPPPNQAGQTDPNEQGDNDIFRYYFMLDRSLRESLSLLNADYILLDKDKKLVTPFPEEYFGTSKEILDKITNEISDFKSIDNNALKLNLSGIEYIAIIRPVSQKNSFGLGFIVIYSSLRKVNQLQLVINVILLSILIFSALITTIFSSRISKKISEPFSYLNQHIHAISERDFGTKIDLPVYDELQEFVDSINVMSEKLGIYDKAQKTFLQNASHEFRTPLMSIQSYAEGIQYDVVDSNTAANIILDESKRMTHLVEDLLYLSRLDTIEENYHFGDVNLNELIDNCVERMSRIALKNNIKISLTNLSEAIKISADEEKLSRSITNIIANCIRYAKSEIWVSLKSLDTGRIEILISDDGPGFDTQEIPNIFERFYKGKKGKFGLGLAISKSIIERHYGKITAENSSSGALFKIELPTV